MTAIPIADYEQSAEDVLLSYLELKKQKVELDKDIKEVEENLSLCFAQGDLNKFKVLDKSALKYGDTLLTFHEGMTTYDYSACSEIKHKEEQLKALKKTYQAIPNGAVKKVGKPFWTVRS
tara:strand:+ start:1786 stop:2145 length:360 start_codon:yes stop_codon:yes gene_type:complete